jgi:hypothetical protein
MISTTNRENGGTSNAPTGRDTLERQTKSRHDSIKMYTKLQLELNKPRSKSDGRFGEDEYWLSTHEHYEMRNPTINQNETYLL